MLVNDITTINYRERENIYLNIADSITTLISAKSGNYFVYFPSYKYLNELFKRFVEKNIRVNIVRKKTGMKEKEKEEFLNIFLNVPSSTLVGFAVMGGMFSEGIGLVADYLSGAVIVGVGLPQICYERDIIRDYFEGVNGRGFEYAYIYPGMNRVLQAAGRVIRTEKDR